MSVLLNSISDSESTSTEVPEPPEVPEELADLSQNQDETLDLQLGLNALGGLNHARACAATERSNRRFDDRNHRMHETRMKALGMEGEEKEPGTDDMAQQVLIRSPIHYHYQSPPPANQPTPQQPQPVQQPAPQPVQPATGLSNLAKAAIVTSALLGTGGMGAALYALLNQGGDTVINRLDDSQTGIRLVPPGPPKHKEGGN